MADNTIDTLELQIVSSSSQAEKSLDSLAKKLLSVNKALKGVNTGGLRNYARDMGHVAAAVQSLNKIKVKVPDFGNFSKQIESFGKIDSEKLASSANGIEKVARSISNIGNVNTKDTGINNTINALNRLFNVDMSKFNPNDFSSVATSIGSLANIPDVSSGLNRFVASLQKLANSGANIGTVALELPTLGNALQTTVNKMASSANVSDSVNLFTQSIGRLASAGAKTGQTAAGLDNLAQKTLDFFETMTKAPKISQNTIAMTQALAQLASAGGKVGTSTSTITASFNKLSGFGSKAASSIKKAANSMVSSFKSIGNGSKHLNVASAGFGKLLKSLLPYVGVYQLFNFGKQAMEISSNLTEVQNVVDVTFGDMKQKVEDLAKTSITDFGMSELTAKQISSRFQAMGTSMGFSQEKMSDMSIELTKLAADMASFYNVEQSDMARSLQSVLTGEAEPMRRYGIDLTQTTMQEYALAKGITTKVSAMSQAEKTMLRYQYVMENTAAAQGDFARTSDSWQNQIRILKQSFEALGSIVGGTLINAFKPLVKVLNSVLQKVISFAETVSEALGAIFGWKIEISGGGITDDLDYAAGSAEDLADGADNAAGGLDDATGAAQKLKKTLSVLPFDQLNQLASNIKSTGTGGTSGGSGSGSGTGTGGTGAGTGASAAIVPTDSIFKAYESEIKNLEQLGEYIGEALTNAMKKIDWNKIYDQAKNFGTGLADFLNGLISPELFGELGKTIANALNTALYALNSFGETFEWSEFGLSLATGINKFFQNFKFGLLADTIGEWVNGISDTILTAIDKTEWGTIGKRIGKFLKRTIENIDFSKISGIFSTGFNGIFDFLKNFNAQKPFKGLGKKISSAINKAIKEMNMAEAGKSLSDFVLSLLDELIKAVEGTNWSEFGEKVGDFLANIDWKGILSRIGKLIWEAIKAAVETWKGSFDAAPIETGIFTALGALGLGTKILSFFTKIFTGKSMVQSLVSSITGNGGVIKAVGSALTTGFSAIFTPKGMLVLAVAQGVTYIIQHWDELKKSASDVAEWVGDRWSDISKWVSDKGKEISASTKKAWDTVSKKVSSVAKDVATWAKDKFTNAKTSIGTAWEKVKSNTTTVWDSISSKVGTISSNVKTWAKDRFEAAKTSIGTAWNSVKVKTSEVWGNISSSLSTTWGSLKSTAGTVFGNIKTTISNNWSNISGSSQSLWGTIKSTLSNVWSSIKTDASSKWKNIKDVISNNAKSIQGNVMASIRNLPTSISGIWNSVSKVTGSIWKNISSTVVSYARSITSNISGAFSKLGTSISNIFSGISRTASNLWRNIKSTFSSGINVRYSSSIRSYANGGFISSYASGGFPKTEIWGMNETGNPEMIGRLGNGSNKTAVANNAIISDAIEGAVERAMMRVMMNNHQNPVNVTCYAELRTEDNEVLARAVTKGQQSIDYRKNPTPQFGY